jgi:hypothetical protein
VLAPFEQPHKSIWRDDIVAEIVVSRGSAHIEEIIFRGVAAR